MLALQTFHPDGLPTCHPRFTSPSILRLMHEHSPQRTSVGYLELLRRNKQFRWLWYGQLVSQLGDWLDSIAIFSLLLALTGSGTAVSLVIVSQFLPPALVGLGAGVVVDRLPRKQVMIAADLIRAALVPLLFLIRFT